MKNLMIIPDGAVVQCVTNQPLAQESLVERLGLPMACMGKGLCATCHVVVVKGAENLSPRTEKELRALERLTGCMPDSRLSCQARVLGDVSVRLPEGLFINSVEELTELIGRRAEKNILHPVDGRILISAGQIISRTIVRKLEGTDFKPWQGLETSSPVNPRAV